MASKELPSSPRHAHTDGSVDSSNTGAPTIDPFTELHGVCHSSTNRNTFENSIHSVVKCTKEKEDACLADYQPLALYSEDQLSCSPDDWVSVEAIPDTEPEGNVPVEERVQRLEVELRRFRGKYEEVEESKRNLERYCQRLVQDLDSMNPNPPSLTSKWDETFSDHWERRCHDLERQLEALHLQQKEPDYYVPPKDQEPMTASERDLLLQQLNLYKEDFSKEKIERENLTAEVTRLNSDWNTMRRQRDSAEQEKSEALEQLQQLREEMKDLKQARDKTQMERNALLRQFAKLQAAQQAQAPQVQASSGAAAGTQEQDSKEVTQTVTREQMPFDLRWECKKCTFVNTRMISACEVCATKTELPMFIDGYEVTTPTELKSRKEKKGKKSFVLINPTNPTNSAE